MREAVKHVGCLIYKDMLGFKNTYGDKQSCEQLLSAYWDFNLSHKSQDTAVLA